MPPLASFGDRMWELIKKYRYHLLAGGIFLAAFLLYSLNLKRSARANLFERAVLTVAEPLQEGVARVNYACEHLWRDYVDLVDVHRENLRLRESVRLLNARLAQSQEALIANERLKRLLELKSSQQTPSLAATVIGEDSTPWFKTIVIDRGERDGLREGMPVLAAEGVVGQVVKVAGGSARVLLLTDHASAIAGMIQRSRARGVVKGKGGGLCSLDFTIREEDVKVGDEVITSGIGGIFPKGLPLGEVTMVRKGEYGIFQTVEIRPAVNLTRLEEVLVLLRQSAD